MPRKAHPPELDPIVKEALDRFQVAADACSEQRKREEDALKFQDPQNIWSDEAKLTRAATTIGDAVVPARPMLSIPKLDQPIQLVLNQEKAAHLGVQIHPLSEDADDDTAEVLQGLYRAIERDSRANLARSWLFDRVVKAGTGAYRVLKEYADDGGSKFDQKIVIKRLYNQGAAYVDPFAQEPDKSDAEWGFIFSDYPADKYKREFPNSELAQADGDDLREIGDYAPDWITTGDSGAKTYRVAEYFYRTYQKRKIVLLDDGSDAYEDAIPAGRSILTGEHAKSREVDEPTVKWCKHNAVEILEESDWDGKYIPIITGVGKELQPYDGQKRIFGMIEPAKDSVRLFSYAITAAVEKETLDTKAPWIGPEGFMEGHESEWAQANVRNFPALQYKPTGLAGTPNPPPARNLVGADLTGSLELARVADEAIQSSTSTFDPSLGKPQGRRPMAKESLLGLQEQSNAANSHWLDNLAEITLAYEAKVVLDLIPHVYDRPGRIARILGVDDKPSTVMLNSPFTTQDGKPQPAQPGGEAKHYDLTKGVYGVSVTVGKSYNTRLEQGADQLGMLFQAEPQLFGMLGDIWLKFQDWPGHTEAAERLKKMLPSQLQDEPEQAAAKMQQQLATAMQQHDLLVQHVKKLDEELKTDKVKADAQVQMKQIERDMKIELQKMSDATALAVAKIKAGVDLAVAEDEAIALHQQLTHDSAIAAADAGHEEHMAEKAHRQALELGQQAADLGMVQAEQGQAHALEQGERGHQQNLEAQEQAADLAPEPAAGA